MNHINVVGICFLILCPNSCFAFDWGDFHKLAVVFGTILGFGLGFFAICLVLYYGCMRPFFDNFKEEVAQTHRTWHPWPIGSVRWQLQQLVRSGRSTTGTQFPTTPPASHKLGSNTQYLNVPSLQDTFVQPAPYIYGRSVDEIPIIRSTDYSAIDRSQQPRSCSSYLFQERIIDRPTYFTPTPDKPILEEYTIMREESFVSRGKQDDNKTDGSRVTVPADETTIVRTTTTRHSQRALKPGSTFI